MQYLCDPPQLSDTKRYVREREIEFPVSNTKLGKLSYVSLAVEVDIEDMQKRYGSKVVEPFVAAVEPQ